MVLATFIVTGLACTLYGLTASLLKIRVPNGSNESKVEYLQATAGVQCVLPRRWCGVSRPVSPGWTI